MSNTKHCLRIYIKVTGGDTVTFNQMKSQDDFKKKVKTKYSKFCSYIKIVKRSKKVEQVQNVKHIAANHTIS